MDLENFHESKRVQLELIRNPMPVTEDLLGPVNLKNKQSATEEERLEQMSHPKTIR